MMIFTGMKRLVTFVPNLKTSPDKVVSVASGARIAHVATALLGAEVLAFPHTDDVDSRRLFHVFFTFLEWLRSSFVWHRLQRQRLGD
jgi:hypothetical protein